MGDDSHVNAIRLFMYGYFTALAAAANFVLITTVMDSFSTMRNKSFIFINAGFDIGASVKPRSYGLVS